MEGVPPAQAGGGFNQVQTRWGRINSVTKGLAVRWIRTASTVAGIAGFLAFFSGVGFAASGPTLYAGETVDVFTLPHYGSSGLSISLFALDGGSFNATVPLTYVGQISGDYTPAFASQDGINWGDTWGEYRFEVPAGETPGQSYGALIHLSSGGVVFTRFVGYPAPDEPYGTQYTFEADPPAGQLPEVPYTAALPLVAAGLWGLSALTRRIRSTG